MKNEIELVLRKQEFIYLWVSQIFSQLTVNIMNFLLLTHLYVVTQSTIATSLLWVSYSLPALIVGPIGAASTDLVSRRKTLMITNLVQCIVIFSYLFANQSSIFLLYAVVLAYSVLNQFYVPAESAFLPSTVNESLLPGANSLFLLTMQASLVFGFGFAGIFQKLIGFNGTLIMCSVFLFIAFVSTSFLTEVKPKTKIPDKFGKVLQTFFDSILEGYEFIRKNKSILFPLLILLGLQAALAIVVVNLPVIATSILNISVSYSGVSIVVPAGIGAFLGSIYIPKIIKKGGMRKKTVIEISMTAVGLTLLVISLLIPILNSVVRLMLTPILIGLSGFAFVGINIPTLTFLQKETPLWLRGRVFGNLWVLVTIVTMLPVLFSGAITEVFGIKTMIVIMAAIVFFALYYSISRGQELIDKNFSK